MEYQSHKGGIAESGVISMSTFKIHEQLERYKGLFKFIRTGHHLFEKHYKNLTLRHRNLINAIKITC